MLGRRGPEHAAFTMPELIGLRGLVARGALRVVLDTGGAELDLADPKSAMLAEIAAVGATGATGATGDAGAPTRTLALRFRTTPTRVVGAGRVEGLEVSRDGVTEVLATGLVVRSVGFRGAAVPGLPFDEATGTVPHERGRVEPGTYVAGWIKRGPRGFIGTNKSCAAETVSSLLDDLDAGLPGPAVVPGPLPGTIGLAGWRAIDAEERRRGEAQGRARATIVDLDELHRIAEEAEHPAPAAGRPRKLAPLRRRG